LTFRELMDHLPSHPDQGGNSKTSSSQSQPIKLIMDSSPPRSVRIVLVVADWLL